MAKRASWEPGEGPHPPDDEPYRSGIGFSPEGGIDRLGHVGAAVHPVGYGPPVPLGDSLYEIAQALAQADGDGEADLLLAADPDHGMGIEAAVGPHRKLSLGPGVAHPAHRLPEEMASAPAGVGLPLPQPGHQHVAGVGGHGQQRVIATPTGVAVVAGALLGQAVGLADGGIQVDGQRSVAGTGPGSPGSGQQLPAHPVELADVAPSEAAQEGAQGGRGLDHAAQDTGGSAAGSSLHPSPKPPPGAWLYIQPENAPLYGRLGCWTVLKSQRLATANVSGPNETTLNLRPKVPSRC